MAYADADFATKETIFITKGIDFIAKEINSAMYNIGFITEKIDFVVK
uniref:Uncharacterized protein n=1 Tax=Candidatus Kentrum sp. LPFa TaxID=2126335 RepID=A0A450XZ09_9GAMM|nr:MAG: hypothetical protein BECKLPF1236A_GA0070988_100892 [Candidatus Kentron sp. LPFa]VFK34496.1 MAG: hypothetical protein BECKLPF1236C_GA0070990_102752 [Candidatus Kentron sp. LPFa]